MHEHLHIDPLAQLSPIGDRFPSVHNAFPLFGGQVVHRGHNHVTNHSRRLRLLGSIRPEAQRGQTGFLLFGLFPLTDVGE